VIAGGTLLGITGALLAVPTAAALGVLLRFAVQRYRESALYADGAGKVVQSADGVDAR
jgi:predicted PurR-regulated permease PerM